MSPLMVRCGLPEASLQQRCLISFAVRLQCDPVSRRCVSLNAWNRPEILQQFGLTGGVFLQLVVGGDGSILATAAAAQGKSAIVSFHRRQVYSGHLFDSSAQTRGSTSTRCSVDVVTDKRPGSHCRASHWHLVRSSPSPRQRRATGCCRSAAAAPASALSGPTAPCDATPPPTHPPTLQMTA